MKEVPVPGGRARRGPVRSTSTSAGNHAAGVWPGKGNPWLILLNSSSVAPPPEFVVVASSAVNTDAVVGLDDECSRGFT
ncbi:hypothetical protein VTN02DRAFT_2652 [Thermoascus thermophilus]